MRQQTVNRRQTYSPGRRSSSTVIDQVVLLLKSAVFPFIKRSASGKGNTCLISALAQSIVDICIPCLINAPWIRNELRRRFASGAYIATADNFLELRPHGASVINLIGMSARAERLDPQDRIHAENFSVPCVVAHLGRVGDVEGDGVGTHFALHLERRSSAFCPVASRSVRDEAVVELCAGRGLVLQRRLSWWSAYAVLLSHNTHARAHVLMHALLLPIHMYVCTAIVDNLFAFNNNISYVTTTLSTATTTRRTTITTITAATAAVAAVTTTTTTTVLKMLEMVIRIFWATHLYQPPRQV